jgi:hypothetical protein
MASPPLQPEPSPPLPTPPLIKPRPAQTTTAPKREVRTPTPTEAVAAPSTTPAPTVAPSAPLQLEPYMPNEERNELKKKITQELESARNLLAGLKMKKLTPDQESYKATILDFIKKSKQALDRGDYLQSFAMAQKANTLALSLAKQQKI